MKIAVNTGGGDAPGLNAVLRALTLGAESRGLEVWGIRHGYRGLLEPEEEGLVRLDRAAVRGIAHLGGTILGSTNRGDPFAWPVLRGGALTPVDRGTEVAERLAAQGFEALVVLGGDGSLRIAQKLLGRGVPRVIGVPKTIDNDLPGTDRCFGFSTAVSTAVEALDRLHTTAQAHDRVMVAEVMGRDAGFIALHAGVAGGADVILIPELPFDLERVAEKILARERAGRRFSIVVAAEGASARGGSSSVLAPADAFREHVRLGGVGALVAQQLERLTGKEARSLVLGHLLRGGSPVAEDRVLAQRLGAAAARFLAGTTASGLVAVRGGEVVFAPLECVLAPPRRVSLEDDLITTARDLGICFGDEERPAP